MRKKCIYSILEEINTELKKLKEYVYSLEKYKDEKQQKPEDEITVTVTMGNSYYEYLKKYNIDVVKDYVLVRIDGKNYSGFFSNYSIVKGRSIDGNLIYTNSKCKIEVSGKIYNEKFINWLEKNNVDIKVNNGLINCYAAYTVKIDAKSDKKYIDDLILIER